MLMRRYNCSNFRFFVRPKGYFVCTWQSSFIRLKHT